MDDADTLGGIPLVELTAYRGRPVEPLPWGGDLLLYSVQLQARVACLSPACSWSRLALFSGGRVSFQRMDACPACGAPLTDGSEFLRGALELTVFRATWARRVAAAVPDAPRTHDAARQAAEGPSEAS